MDSTVNHRLIASGLWQSRAQKHEEELLPVTSVFRKRRSQGLLHPVEDFLFTYYPYTAGKLEQWHPAFDEVLDLQGGEALPHFSQKRYQRVRQGGEKVMLDMTMLQPKEIERFKFTRELLSLTAQRPPNFACHGLHEWAMVYETEDARHRERAPLRLSASEIKGFVDSQTLACSHFDAVRFFTSAAAPRNRLSPTLLTRRDYEQPGCIHANMDLYKWAFKSMPWIGSDLLRKAFFQALKLRELDMRASPYDLSDYGYSAIRIETPEGRAEYACRQQELAEAASSLRAELIYSLDKLLLEVTSR